MSVSLTTNYVYVFVAENKQFQTSQNVVLLAITLISESRRKEFLFFSRILMIFVVDRR